MSTAGEGHHGLANTVHGHISGGTVVQGKNVHLALSATGQVDWPIRIGAIPEQAAHYQHRDIAEQLDQALDSFGTVVLRQVLSGTGGVGKTQLAAHHARTLTEATDPEQRLDVLVWANAATRSRITDAYAQAARHLFATVPDDSEDAAQLFLSWLGDPSRRQNRRWLIVWDDLADPAAVRDLWPPHEHPHGRVLVTTRRRDHSLTQQGRHLLEVDVYTPDEACAFLTRALGEAGIGHTTDELEHLARDLGHLPLALGQAVTYMAELRLEPATYRELFHDRMRTLAEVFPDWESPTPLAATWELSVNQADTFTPQGLARQVMGLIALLDGTAIPEQVLTAPPVLEHLAISYPQELTQHEVRAALASLHRLNLITRTSPPEASQPGGRLVSTHQLVQRATREHTRTRPTREGVHTLADALLNIWPGIERDTTLSQQLRSNTAVLRTHHGPGGSMSEDWLWEPEGRPVLFRTGRSLGGAGRVGEAVAYWQHMADTAHQRLGPDHSDTLLTRANLARWQGEAGDPAAAATALHHLLADQQHLLGPDHSDTLLTRATHAHWQGEAGDAAAAAHTLEHLLPDRTRVLGPDHPHTLLTRATLARWQGEAGDPAAAATALHHLLADQQHLLGPHHPHTLTTRHELARFQGQAGDSTAAAHTLEHLLPDRTRVLGPDHPNVLATRHYLAYWTYESASTGTAVELLTELLTDRIRVLGDEHPDTHSSRELLEAWQDELSEG